MKHEVELKLQAWVDGQLPVHEADEVARLIETDAEARAMLTELKHTRSALVGHEDGIKLPESREFYWSKIARDIERQQSKPQSAPVAWFHHLRRLLIPAGAVAALLLVGLLATPGTAQEGLPYELTDLVADSDAFTYTDEVNGTTLIWFSYPSENELAESDDWDIL
jgi:anti-sigma factor RsiW